jgi:hypothetical protein
MPLDEVSFFQCLKSCADVSDLHEQFETLNPKVKYKAVVDPSVEETKKQCLSLRKNARDERTVFYYNGHGVPKPTASGEIWVFNKSEPASISSAHNRLYPVHPGIAV